METLIFDCDGVLVDSEAIAEAVIVQRLGEWLPDIQPAAMLRQALGMTTAAILEHIERHSAHSLPSDALLRIESDIEKHLERDLQAIEGVLEAVAELRLPLAIVSNSSRRRVQASLANTGLLETLLGEAPLFTADQVERPKPAPDVYLLAARSLNSEPRDCLVVEDSVSGVTAAHAAGMTVIGFTGASHIEPGHGERLKQVGAWRVLQRMWDLDGLIQQWRESRSQACARRDDAR
ncbi:haloacid dehalogenase superfamily, subfamily IA, variant 3 with third motif having DD or ED [Modicisalibacter muralis]|uniref:Haloacid dehalogenase superfamily, subfamily IA, variant 3 with third motif having DD or ED n=1 Tax=Modicisalibacter muralis TaxID=119000 RepID=A0A1G9JH54_9GAMM|nr:HAD family hydrolase [Halomonas muralis]SDL36910.1 haloacid dehalogenase superfamily, subfamily IA, variant 3 with third motif having DD or ED [Halomonas muralis]